MTALYDRVYETTTTTGTGNLSLAGAITGFRAFSSVYADADTLYYSVEAVDGSGIPTGEWETGLGTYNTSGNTLSRTTVHASSNAGAAVNFSAGTKRVSVSVTQAAMGSWTYAFVASDVTNNTTTPSNVTGLSFTPAASKKYEFEAFLSCTSAATTTGCQVGLSWPTGSSFSMATARVQQGATALSESSGDATSELVASATAAPSATATFAGSVRGTITMGGSPSGSVQVRVRSEVGSSQVAIKAGSWLRYREIN